MANELRFHTIYKLCPVCGTPLTHTSNSVVCPSCGVEIYHNPTPCVTIMIVKEGKVLLAKRKFDPQKGLWDAPGGFIDVGETAEQAAIRELKEETNLDALSVRYIGSANDVYAGIPTLALIFEAQVPDVEPIAQDDVASLAWIPLDKIPKDIAFYNTEVGIQLMITKYVKELKV